MKRGCLVSGNCNWELFNLVFSTRVFILHPKYGVRMRIREKGLTMMSVAATAAAAAVATLHPSFDLATKFAKKKNKFQWKKKSTKDPYNIVMTFNKETLFLRCISLNWKKCGEEEKPDQKCCQEGSCPKKCLLLKWILIKSRSLIFRLFGK